MVLIGVFFIVTCFFTLILSIVTYESGVFINIIYSLIFGVITGALIGMIIQKPIAYETQYKVTISEEVALKDFYDKYKIIEQDGKIFTIREIK